MGEALIVVLGLSAGTAAAVLGVVAIWRDVAEYRRQKNGRTEGDRA